MRCPRGAQGILVLKGQVGAHSLVAKTAPHLLRVHEPEHGRSALRSSCRWCIPHIRRQLGRRLPGSDQRHCRPLCVSSPSQFDHCIRLRPALVGCATKRV
jgi:hypothetical protein